MSKCISCDKEMDRKGWLCPECFEDEMDDLGCPEPIFQRVLKWAAIAMLLLTVAAYGYYIFFVATN